MATISISNIIALLVTVAAGVPATPVHPMYAPNQIIVKFRGRAADVLEQHVAQKTPVSRLTLSPQLDALNAKYRAKEIKPLFKGFKKNRQRLENLKKKDKWLLTKKEKHILRRLRRAPKNAQVPDLSRIYKITFDLGPSQSIEQVLAAYNESRDVEYAELNYIVSIDLTPNDPLYPIQWPLNNTGQMYPDSGRYNPPPGTPDCDIDAREAWDMETGSSEVVVAVIDTGVDYTHRDLDDNMWVNESELHGNPGFDDDQNGYIDDIYGYDFVNGDNNPIDDHGHGTHCAGIIAAEGNNGLDITGVCWKARIMGLKFLNSGGWGSTSDAVDALYYAVENGAEVTSNSWGGGSYFLPLEEAIDYAHSQGVIFVAAAGNIPTATKRYPAYYEHVVAVAATNSNDGKAPFSTYGDWVEIAAPGVDVLSLRASDTSKGTVYDDYTTVMSGTSMACPHVSGACALMLSFYPEMLVDELKQILFESTDPVSPQLCASGRLNVRRAVASNSVLMLDRDLYACSGFMAIKLLDADLKGNMTQEVTVAAESDSETLLLAEANSTPGMFTATIALDSGDPNLEDGIVQLAHGEIITATYYDANCGTGNPAVLTDTAVADCQTPEISNVNVINIACTGAWVTFDTDEPTTARVLCDELCAGPYTIFEANSTLKTSHSILVSALTYETTYHFEIQAQDAVGNEITDSNQGQCYTFTTTPKPPGLHVPSQYPTIQAAIDAALDGNTIYVADGTHTGPGNRDIDFKGKAITVRSEMGPENCIIDCNAWRWTGNYRGFYFHQNEDTNSVLQGFTIINGYLPGPNMWNEDPNHCTGAGIFCLFSSPTITDCLISNCRTEFGAGIACAGGAPVIANCTVENCYAGGFGDLMSGGHGAGIALMRGCNAEVTNCTITNNYGYYNSEGGGLFCHDSSPHIKESSFSNNMGDCGGGAYCGPNSTIVFENCIISANYSWDGGGMYNDSSSPTLINCTFNANRANFGYGGAIHNLSSSPTLTNCLLIGNSAFGGRWVFAGGSIIVQRGGNGGALFSYNSSLMLANCTFAGNAADVGNAFACNPNDWHPSYPSYVQMTNCILWDGGDEVWYSDGSVINITHSDVQGGWPGIGNIDADPCFVDAAAGDYHIGRGSPCIDRGDNTALPPDTTDLDRDSNTTEPIPFDFDGYPRVVDGNDDGNSVVDIGAYEYGAPLIHLSSTHISFSGVFGGATPHEQVLVIRNCGPDTLSWQIAGDCSWLQANPPSGESTTEPNYVVLTVDTAGLSWGEHHGLLTISADGAANSPRTVEVTLHLQGPRLELGPKEFEFSYEGSNPPAQALSIWNGGGGPLCWQITKDRLWLQVNPSSGESTGERNEVTLCVDCNGMQPGLYNCLLEVSAPGAESSPQTVAVDLEVRGEVLHVPTIDYPTIQAAIDAADGWDLVIVADGTYTGEGNRDLDFNGVAITVRSENGPESCIIDCQNAGRAFYFHNGEGPDSVVEGFTITEGYASFGGAIANQYASPTVRNCIFTDNTAEHWGGAIDNDHSSPVLIDCVFAGNTACTEGGGIANYYSSMTSINSIFTRNSAYYGAGMGYQYSTPQIINCTFSDNAATASGGAVSNVESEAVITNSILWNNAPDEIEVETGTTTVTYSDVQGGYSGEGNINTDPCFADPCNDDYHLKSQVGRWDPNQSGWIEDADTSPCIDAGDPNSDWTNEPWPNGYRVNMGAYGNTKEASKSSTGFDDLARLANAWLKYDPCIDAAPPPDGDGIVNFLDFAILAHYWLWEQ